MSITISGTGAITGASTSYSFDQSVSIGGTVTYEDVTSVDSVGIITAQAGIHVTGGNTGIGTDNPIAKLVVNSGNTNLASQIVSDDAEVFLAFKDGDSTGNQQVQIGGVGNNFVAYAGGSERLRIGSSGQLGIEGANYGSAGQVLTSVGSSAAPTCAFANTFSFFVEQASSTVQNVTTNTYTRLTGYRTITNNSLAIATGTSSVATWNSTNGTLTIGADGGGLWYFSMMAGIDDIQAGDYVQVVIGKNGAATDVGTRLSSYGRSWSSSNANVIVVAQTFCIASCSPNDVVSAYVYHNESTTEPTEQNRCHFMGYKLSALT